MQRFSIYHFKSDATLGIKYVNSHGCNEQKVAQAAAHAAAAAAAAGGEGRHARDRLLYVGIHHSRVSS